MGEKPNTIAISPAYRPLKEGACIESSGASKRLFKRMEARCGGPSAFMALQSAIGQNP